ncbi:divalent-cation tolerance protein CutA [Serratia symbiotica]|nr:divalent-cation tolerance protein CutA [Serratia symbiotica]
MPDCEAITILCSAVSDQANAQQLAVPVVLNTCIALPHDVKAGNGSKIRRADVIQTRSSPSRRLILRPKLHRRLYQTGELLVLPSIAGDKDYLYGSTYY